MSRFIVAALWAATIAAAQDARQIMQKVQDSARAESQRYEGTLQVTRGDSKIAEKRWNYQRIGSAGESKVVLRFTAPAEVKGVALLVVNHPDRASDQWMWTPALARNRRIALQDRSTRFFGTDFSFEDLEERDVNQFDYKLLGEENLDGQPCWRIESRPRRTKSSQYTHSQLWVRKDPLVIVRIDAYRGDKLVRRIRYSEYKPIQKIWTPLRLEVEDIDRRSKTVLRTEELEYNIPLREDAFTLQGLRRES